MRSKITVITLSILIVFGLSGCGFTREPEEGKVLAPIEQNTISTELLAAKLGLRVDERQGTHITLRNAQHTVMLFLHHGAEYYIDGKPAGKVGNVTYSEGSHYFLKSLEAELKEKLGATLQPIPPTAPAKVRGTVVIDAGHGGKDPGATGVNDVFEKTINLSVARKVAYELGRREIHVIMTRNADLFIPLEERAEIANRNNADLFVSIHADASHDVNRRGFRAFIARSASKQSRIAARAILRAMDESGLNNLGIGEANYKVLVQTRGPAILFEMGFMSNLREANMLSNNSFQNTIALSLTEGIIEALRKM